MEYIKGIVEREKSGYEEFLEKEEGDTACLEGAVHSLRDMGEIGFVILRSREGFLQAVWEEGVSREDLKEFHEGDCIRVTGTVKTEERAPQGKELRIKETEWRELPEDSGISSITRALRRSTVPRSEPKAPRAALTYSSWNISIIRQYSSRALSFINR